MSSTTGSRSDAPGRPRLTRERVLAAALALIDREGVEGLSMRKLGAELGVEAMSLYNHVDDKHDVLAGVVSLLWREVGARAEGRRGPWQQQARELAQAVRETAHDHPHAYPLVLTTGAVPPELLAIAGPLLDAMRDAGFGDLAADGVLAIGSHAASQALAEVSWYGAWQFPAPGEVAGVDAATREATEALAACDPDAQFAFSLDLLLAGLEATLAGRLAGEG